MHILFFIIDTNSGNTHNLHNRDGRPSWTFQNDGKRAHY